MKQVGEAAAEGGGEAGGAVAVAGQPPGDRARDPAAVEREGGDQVEDQHEDVDARPARRSSRAGPRSSASGSTRIAAENSSRAGDGEPDRRSRRARSSGSPAGPAAAILNSVPASRSPAHARDAAEQPQRDLGDRDPVAERDHAWPSSCSRIEPKKSEGAEATASRYGLESDCSRAEHVAVEAREPDDDQEEDEEPGVVDPDPDPPEREQGQLAARRHRLRIVGRSAGSGSRGPASAA